MEMRIVLYIVLIFELIFQIYFILNILLKINKISKKLIYIFKEILLLAIFFVCSMFCFGYLFQSAWQIGIVSMTFDVELAGAGFIGTILPLIFQIIKLYYVSKNLKKEET